MSSGGATTSMSGATKFFISLRDDLISCPADQVPSEWLNEIDQVRDIEDLTTSQCACNFLKSTISTAAREDGKIPSEQCHLERKTVSGCCVGEDAQGPRIVHWTTDRASHLPVFGRPVQNMLRSAISPACLNDSALERLVEIVRQYVNLEDAANSTRTKLDVPCGICVCGWSHFGVAGALNHAVLHLWGANAHRI